MRAVVQRVSAASVTVEGRKVGTIGPGLLVLLGVARGDTEKDGEYLAEKLAGLRIFEDEEEKMNRSVAQIGGSILLVSQFTLYGDVRHGRRPSFTQAGQRTDCGERTVPGPYGSVPGERRAGYHPAGQREKFLGGNRKP